MKLEDFNNLYGHLNLELTEEPKQISKNLYNTFNSPTAKIKKLKFILETDDDFEITNNEFRKLNKEELKSTLLRRKQIKMVGEGCDTIYTYQAPNGKYFTVKDIIKCIERTERKSRPKSDWFGGIDTHHIFFEGLMYEDGLFSVCWGS